MKLVVLSVVFVLASVLGYFAVLLVAAFVVASEGGGISCTSNCSPTQEWLNDAHPWPILASIALTGVPAAWVTRRVGRWIDAP